MIPGGVSARVIGQMEDVLGLYAQEYQPEYPTVCIDEAGKELVKQVKPIEPMQAGKVARQD